MIILARNGPISNLLLLKLKLLAVARARETLGYFASDIRVQAHGVGVVSVNADSSLSMLGFEVMV